jgi:selenide,water dikinase
VIGKSSDTVTSTVLDRAQSSERCGCLAKLDGGSLECVLHEAYAAAQGAPSVPSGDSATLPPIAGTGLASVDFGPLVCPDPLRAGRIAATHAMSDIFAGGGRPLAALAMLVVEPEAPRAVGTALMTGLIEACASEQVPILGGHTIVGDEAMTGLAVIGSAQGSRFSKDGGRPGDLLFISKPLGNGILLRAYRQGLIEMPALEPALTWMEHSNREAAAAAGEAGVLAATDVTGFGLLGHLAEMLRDSGCGAQVDAASVPLIDGARNQAASLYRSPWIARNLDFCRGIVLLSAFAGGELLGCLADPQTSGGLLVAAPRSRGALLEEAGFQQIGSLTQEMHLEVST